MVRVDDNYEKCKKDPKEMHFKSAHSTWLVPSLNGPDNDLGYRRKPYSEHEKEPEDRYTLGQLVQHGQYSLPATLKGVRRIENNHPRSLIKGPYNAKLLVNLPS